LVLGITLKVVENPCYPVQKTLFCVPTLVALLDLLPSNLIQLISLWYPDSVSETVHILQRSSVFYGVRAGLEYIYKPYRHPTLKRRMPRQTAAI
jgi:hypothetical protein